MDYTQKSLQKWQIEQLSEWELAAQNYKAINEIRYKEVEVFGTNMKLQFNPARIISATAVIDKNSILGRPCFLCRKNRPKVQKYNLIKTTSGNEYEFLINPYPLSSEHYILASLSHSPQTINERTLDLLEFAMNFSEYSLMYNGPMSGASAPDHHHFQVIPKGFLPIESNFDNILKEKIYSTSMVRVEILNQFIPGSICIISKSAIEAERVFNVVKDSLFSFEGEYEPRMNLISWFKEGCYYLFIAPRTAHRPSTYFLEGENQILISPGAADLAGILITPKLIDFERVGTKTLEGIIRDVCLDKDQELELRGKLDIALGNIQQPNIQVGIMKGDEIEINFYGDFLCKEAGESLIKEVFKYDADAKAILWRGTHYKELNFDAAELMKDYFEVEGVIIGINFHWERKERQAFNGSLRLVVEENAIRVVNIIGLEDYLISVISSEMSATASMEFLKAHAVISRSWLLAQIQKRGEIMDNDLGGKKILDSVLVDQAGGTAIRVTTNHRETHKRIKWYDREDHIGFDVCADDHCQRYQGITKICSENAIKAVLETWGEVLTYDERICDARFSKCCGGVMEEFETCWQDVNHPYLVGKKDAGENEFPDLTIEENAKEWILSRPSAFCDTLDAGVLSQVLNDYDQETKDFYRWEVHYSQAEISDLIKSKLGCDLGNILDIIPLKRGVSGRMYEMKIVGEKDDFIVGKELEIRKVLSKSHLYSSAFVVERVFQAQTDTICQDNESNAADALTKSVKTFPSEFIIKGAGWGHGAGLCQIGAAVMGEKGFSYKEILEHYYVGAEIEQRY